MEVRKEHDKNTRGFEHWRRDGRGNTGGEGERRTQQPRRSSSGPGTRSGDKERWGDGEEFVLRQPEQVAVSLTRDELKAELSRLQRKSSEELFGADDLLDFINKCHMSNAAAHQQSAAGVESVPRTPESKEASRFDVPGGSHYHEELVRNAVFSLMPNVQLASGHDLVRIVQHLSAIPRSTKMLLEVAKKAKEITTEIEPYLFHSFINAFRKQGDIDTALLLLKEMRENGTAPDSKIFNSLLAACEEIGVSKASKVWAEVKATQQVTGSAPSPLTYNAMLRVCGRHGDVDKTVELIQEMEEQRILPDAAAYNSLLIACSRRGEHGRAFSAFEQMRARNVTPNVITFNILIGMSAKERNLDKSLELLDEMKTYDLVPSAQIMNNVALLSCNKGDLNRAIGLLHLMRRMEPPISPEPNVVHGLVDASTRAGDPNKALALLPLLFPPGAKSSVGPSNMLTPGAIFNAVIKAHLKENRVGDALATKDKMVASGIVPDAFTFNTLMSACLKTGDETKALDLFEEMKRVGARPNAFTFTILINLYGREGGSLTKLTELVDEMHSAGVRPDLVMFTSLIDIFGKHRQLDRALAMLQQMKLNKVSPDVVTFTSLLAICAKQGNLDKALAVLDMMPVHHLRPGVETLTQMIISFCRWEGKQEDAERIWAAMKKHRVDLSEFTEPLLKRLVEGVACKEKQGRKQRVKEVCEEMEKMGLKPAMVDSIVKSLTKERFVVKTR